MIEVLNKVGKTFKRMLSKIKVATTVVLAVATLMAYLSVLLSPDRFPILALAGMAFPYILIVDILYTLLLIFAKKYIVLVMLAIIAAGYRLVDATVQLNPIHYVEDFDEEDSSFTLMSFNVRLLDRYNWIKGKSDTRLKIFEFLKYESPDIACFQEFYNNSQDSITNEQIIQNLLQTRYIARDYNPDDHSHKTNKGYRIFSKFMLSNVQPIFDHTDNLIGIFADADVDGRTLRIFNFHLKSIKLGYDDYDFIDQIQDKNNTEQVSGIMNIYNKLSKAFEIRVAQSRLIRSMIDKSPYPVMVCGDFNDPPVSFSRKTILGDDLLDAFSESGTGFGGTIRIRFLDFRIDYIMHSKSLDSRAFRTHKENLSDHFAISCKLKFH